MNFEHNQHPDIFVPVATEDEAQPGADAQMTQDPMSSMPVTNSDNSAAGINEVDQPADDEPNWERILQHDPARTEVPIFLAGRSRRDETNDRLGAGLDLLHNSVAANMKGLGEVVKTLLNDRAEKLYEYEVILKNDYVYNEKSRASMHAKLEESAKMAQGLFANLLMRVAQPGDEAGAASAIGAAGVASNPGIGANSRNESGGGEEPDWDAIMMHEPARTEVPSFLAAQSRGEAACTCFAAAIEEFQTSIDGYAEDLTQTVADIYNNRTTKLDEYDQILKHDYVANDEMRAKMQSNLEDSATAAHNMFNELMNRVMQPQPLQQSATIGILTQATTLGSP